MDKVQNTEDSKTNKPYTIHSVVRSGYNWKTEQKKNFCRNRQCPFYDGWSYGCKQRSDAKKCVARQHY